MDLPFPSPIDKSKPLAERMRARTLDEFIGQDHLIGPGTLLRTAIEQKNLRQSLILWGPPGCGKTTLARIIAASVGARFVEFSAVTSGIADVKRVIADARRLRSAESRPFFLFVDELHRFNKAQQDAFLPHVEDGTIVLIGATTENPSFEVIGPLLSRSRVLVLEALATDQVLEILRRTLADRERGLGAEGVEISEDVLAHTAELAHGDARVALNALGYATSVVARGEAPRVVTGEHIDDAMQRPVAVTDKGGEGHYNMASALIKSLRGSDVDAALYWLARICEAGEDPLFVARRLVIFASEDVGNADPQALALAVAAKDAVQFVGYPECKLALSQAVTYLALAPKSNASTTAYGRAAGAVRDNPPYPVPLHIRQAPTRLMRDLGYGKGYDYPHDHDDTLSDQRYLPEEIDGSRFYEPKDAGFEKELKARRDEIDAKRRKKT